MGYGSYSINAHNALVAGRSHLAGAEVFAQTQCHALMNPKGLKVRECRDSPDHQDSLGIIFALDETGSMGDIPQILAKQELPKFMKLLMACGITDPQVMFMAVGDATSDGAPLQVGQFESTAELMDQWLTWSYLEGNGGGTGSESYELPLYVAAQHTDMDNWVKRRKKGYLFMTGDELPYPAVSRHQVDSLLGEKLDEDIPIEEVISAAAEMYHIFFLIPDPERAKRCGDRWRQLLGDQAIVMESPADACTVAAALVGITEQRIADLKSLAAVFSDHQISREQISSTLRAITEYAARHHLIPLSADGSAVSSGEPAKHWWNKLFD